MRAWLWLRFVILLGLTGTAGAAVAPIENFLDGLDTMRAQFRQIVVDTETGRRSDTTGTFFLRRPNQFLWRYDKPAGNYLLADGSRVWNVEADLGQVSHRSQDAALEGTPARILMVGGELEHDFEVIDLGDSQGMHWLRLVPRSAEAAFEQVLIGFEKEQLSWLEMTDRFGQMSRLEFSAIERNPQLEADLFKFRAPEGYDLFEY